jgi:4-amino-4-deoxy-L-arabinose transferase-like glycosyltransferase
MERPVLAIVVLAAFALRAFGFDQDGWGAEYYAAAARSMAQGWRNFLYCAFDPAGFISVDKPPLALWVQVASVKLFGYSPASVLLPQAVEGTLCVWLMHRIARPRFGAAVALVAAALLAITPVVVAMNRTNNVDSALLLVLMTAALAMHRAVETGERARLFAAMALLGVAFNVKMLAAFVFAPAFAAAWLWAAPLSTARRLGTFVAASAIMLAVAIAWIAFFDATPQGERPYAGSSRDNSMFELAMGHNAASRFVRVARPAATNDAAPEATSPSIVAQRRVFVNAPPGPSRLLDGRLAAQVAWLLPFAIFGVATTWRGERRRRSPAASSLLFWTAWLAIGALVYSAAGGIFHYYYLAPLAPALSLFAALGIVHAWRAFGEGDFHARVSCVLAVAATAAWQLYVHVDAMDWSWSRLADPLADWRVAMAVAAIASACVAAGAAWLDRRAFAVAVLALSALPLAWTASAIVVPVPGTLPSADLYRLDSAVRIPPRTDVSALVAWLRERDRGERFILATTTTRISAPLIIATGRPVMAMGGFHGLDRAITPEELARRAAAKEVRFVLVGDAAPPSRRLGADAALEPLEQWIRSHGRRVESRRWQAGLRARGLEMYDLARAAE